MERRVLHLPPPIGSTPGPSSHTPAATSRGISLAQPLVSYAFTCGFHSRCSIPSGLGFGPTHQRRRPTPPPPSANSSHKTASTQPRQPAVSQPLDTPPATSSRLPGLSFLDFLPSRPWIWATLRLTLYILRLTLYITRRFTLCHISVSPLTCHCRRQRIKKDFITHGSYENIHPICLIGFAFPEHAPVL